MLEATLTRARRQRWVALASFAAVQTACFTGADALHLPCERDEDCGRGQSCVGETGGKFCDGPPDSQGGTSPDTTTTTQDGSTTASPSSSEGEPPIPVCGNAMLEEGEDCDDGVDSIDCNSKQGCEGEACCRVPTCGDGYVNAARGEGCDPPTPMPLPPDTQLHEQCSPICTLPLFANDFDQDPGLDFALLPGGTKPDGFDPPWPVPDRGGWEFDDNWGQLSSGPYYPAKNIQNGGVIYAIMRDAIAVPISPDGFRHELRFRHAYRFEGPSITGACDPLDARLDGGIVMIWSERVGELLPLEPFLASYGVIEPSNMLPNDCTSVQCPLGSGNDCRENPLGGMDGFVTGAGAIDALIPVRFPIPKDLEGDAIRIAFVLGYSCGNCWANNEPPPDPGWRIDDVVIAVYPQP